MQPCWKKSHYYQSIIKASCSITFTIHNFIIQPLYSSTLKLQLKVSFGYQKLYLGFWTFFFDFPGYSCNCSSRPSSTHDHIQLTYTRRYKISPFTNHHSFQPKGPLVSTLYFIICAFIASHSYTCHIPVQFILEQCKLQYCNIQCKF